MRQSLIALRLAERLGLDEATRGGRLLRRPARLGRLPRRRLRAGEVVRRRPGAQGRRPPRGHGRRGRRRSFVLSHVGAGPRAGGAGSPGRRVRRRRAARRQRDDREPLAGDQRAGGCGSGSARRCATSLYQTFERWDGKGVPAEAKGEEILHAGAAGEPRRRGRGLPPRPAGWTRRSRSPASAAARSSTRRWWTSSAPRRRCCSASIDAVTAWAAVIDAEPALEIVLSDEELESALEAIADFTDLKSPWTIGHSRGVADLARAAAKLYGLSDDDADARAPGRAGARPRPPRRLERDLGQARAAHRGGARAGAPASRT